MTKSVNLEELIVKFDKMTERQIEKLKGIFETLDRTGETIEAVDWMIKHFGETWPEDVRGHLSREKEERKSIGN